MTDLAVSVEQTRADTMLGASDAPAVLGLDKYRPPIAVWRKLRGLYVDETKPAAVQEAADWGLILEPVVRGKYALSVNRGVIVPTASFVSQRRPWLRATPDGVVLPAGIGDPGTLEDAGPWRLGFEVDADGGICVDPGEGLYQGKTCSAYLHHEWEAGVPARHEVQVRVEMAVTGLPWCDVACLVGGQRFVGPYRVHRDVAIELRILDGLDEFKRLVDTGIEPSVDDSAAWREHVSERMRKSDSVLLANTEVTQLLQDWKHARAARKALEAKEEEVKTQVLLRLSAAGATRIKSYGGDVTAYKVGGRISWEKYAASIGGTKAGAEAFRAESKSWALKAPKEWGEDE